MKNQIENQNITNQYTDSLNRTQKNTVEDNNNDLATPFSRELIRSAHSDLAHHPMYSKLNSVESIRIFMEHHVFAVWDFMSLLKRLQHDLTCVTLPWKPSSTNPTVARLINEIVLCEESDVDPAGEATSHFDLYIRAMNEIGADTKPIFDFLKEPYPATIADQNLKDFVSYHLNLSEKAPLHQVVASFFFGREKLLPDIFTSIIEALEKNQVNCPTLVYYFQRHIEVDGDEHGPMAEICLKEVCQKDTDKWQEAYASGLHSLQLRDRLWNSVSTKIERNSREY